MAQRSPQKSIVLILARELASKLATAVFIVDPEGTAVYYNEPAEALLGQTFAEGGELGKDEWGTVFNAMDADSQPVPVDQLPLGIAITKHEPAHRTFWITGLDGVKRQISVTAFPLFARAQEFVGAVAIFWEEAGDSPA
ncbi:MAG: PAS domain-containing protein [Actinobacteria bacterium]|nr:PAS domain-containing protein [Actinomycetota bacterium]